MGNRIGDRVGAGYNQWVKLIVIQATIDLTSSYKITLLSESYHQYNIRYFNYKEKLYNIVSTTFS